MTQKTLPILEGFKKLKQEDFIYLGTLVIFFSAVGVVFYFSVGFFSQSSNKVFTISEEVAPQGLNTEDYRIVAKKLGITIPVLQQDAVSSTAPIALSPVTEPLDKGSLILKVLNGTSKRGVATALAEAITKDGFTVLKTGNDDTPYATTTIVIQESKSAYLPSLLAIIRKSYPNVYSTTTSKITGYDAVVTIGDN